MRADFGATYAYLTGTGPAQPPDALVWQGGDALPAVLSSLGGIVEAARRGAFGTALSPGELNNVLDRALALLRTIGAPARERLVQALGHPAPVVRTFAAHYLGIQAIADAGAIAAVGWMFRNETDPVARHSAAVTLMMSELTPKEVWQATASDLRGWANGWAPGWEQNAVRSGAYVWDALRYLWTFAFTYVLIGSSPSDETVAAAKRSSVARARKV